MITKTERRFILTDTGTELRIAVDGERRRIVHHAPPWNVLSAPLWLERVGERTVPVRERFEPGAFRDLVGGDVVALRDHDTSRVLGRTLAGTLRLEEDGVGLRYEIEPPDTSDGRDVVALIERGDIRGSSFSFRVADGGERWQWVDDELRTVARREATMVLRTISRAARLLDVGPVTFPAYPTEGLGLRSAGLCEDAARGFETWASAGAADLAGLRNRQRLVELGS